MMVSKERTSYLQELIGLSSEATLLIPKIVLNKKIDVEDKYKASRDALNYLKNDNQLIVIEKEVKDDFIEVTIKFRNGER